MFIIRVDVHLFLSHVDILLHARRQPRVLVMVIFTDVLVCSYRLVLLRYQFFNFDTISI